MKEYAEKLLKDMIGENARFHDGQWESIESALNNNRTLVVQKTGWGKSIVYFIASKLVNEKRGGVTILVSPLLSLMRNQIQSARNIGIRAVTINSENADDWSEIENILNNGECDIILISPERLANNDFMERVIPAIKGGPNMIVIDEAHCISDWGHDFRPNYSRIVNVIRTLAPNVPVIATTATANNRVIDDIKTQLGKSLTLIKGSLMRESLNIQVIKLKAQTERMAWLIENINKIDGSGIIYCSTTRDCNNVAEWLKLNGIDALPYHGKLSPDNEIKKTLREERETLLIENKVKVLVSTVALGMGFDKGDISFVIHFQMPSNIIRYYQEIGRAGRKLDDAYAVLLVGEEDREIAEYFIESAFPKREQLENVITTIEESDEGLSLYDLKKHINMTHGGINKCIQLLDLHGIVKKINKKYIRTLNSYMYEDFKVEEILSTRYHELEFMEKYIETNKCYMKFIANELDDNTTKNCEKCCNCIKRKLFPDTVEEKNVKKAEEFVKSRVLKIKVNKKWPAGVIALTGKKVPDEELNEVGRVLSNYGDSGWGKIVEEDKYKKEYFRDELADATIEVLNNKWAELTKVDCISAVPSLRRPELVKSLAERIANKLKVPFLDIIKKPVETEEQKYMENSNMQAKNAYNAFEVHGVVNYENVLLIDDMVDSGWTLTVCGALLKRNGAGKVYPYALASTAKNGGDE
ncbi:RecQ family ATP-dependent DNA helicase [Clostridium algidicarnis]|uniref:RecQ family ATP-dependent DNA helicase n=1 Tax=Clostridium algidicarnis TaxID=37659 RepID=UPI001CF399EC|nr:RecQ family ATP-dependent DNA helicase [Clostridium algidicarnis]MCB2287637.1 RecQ family ATP-dependent DNA helicase [Clostridium algidicarnis]